MNCILLTKDSSTRQMVEGAMTARGITLHVLESVADARAACAQEPAHLVIVDVEPFPIELCQDIRAHKDLVYTVLIACSQPRELAEFQELLKIGIDDVLLKPFDATRLGLRLDVASKAAESWKTHRQTEEALLHAQKMDAVGRLAGGVAHDFNNWLSAILGYTDLALVKIDPASPVRKYIEHIRSAGERATRLTSQLLTFSRKTSADVLPVDPNGVLSEMEPLLRRTIGEHIELKFKLGSSVRNFRADKTQIEQVLLNLSVNARDAMPSGGKLSLETSMMNGADINSPLLAKPLEGEWVVMTVSDTGTGMSQDIQSHLFEPFFTTKPKGKGTGLGLSIVYGIVRHSGGHVFVSSYVGLGSTFTICFPAISALAPRKDTDYDQLFVPGTETLLVVEDEEMVRQMLTSCLQTCGYTVLEAADGAAALAICENLKEKLDLLVTDSVMPRMSGRELALRVRSIYAGIPVLLMSGHMEDVAQDLADGVDFLQKPAKPSDLTRKVRQILDGQKRSAI